ncbi:MAG: hypothetical protein KJ630_20935 [Proteobacteria bacterium]|nr:hypothetical protein [Pseudomonadota bacterium]
MLNTSQKPSPFRKTSLLLLLIVALPFALIPFSAPLLENILVVNTPLQHADAIVVMGMR